MFEKKFTTARHKQMRLCKNKPYSVDFHQNLRCMAFKRTLPSLAKKNSPRRHQKGNDEGLNLI